MVQIFKAILISGFVLLLVSKQLQAQQTKLELVYIDKGSDALLEPFDVLLIFQEKRSAELI